MGEVGGFGTRPYGLSDVMVDFWDRSPIFIHMVLFLYRLIKVDHTRNR